MDITGFKDVSDFQVGQRVEALRKKGKVVGTKCDDAGEVNDVQVAFDDGTTLWIPPVTPARPGAGGA